MIVVSGLGAKEGRGGEGRERVTGANMIRVPGFSVREKGRKGG